MNSDEANALSVGGDATGQIQVGGTGNTQRMGDVDVSIEHGAAAEFLAAFRGALLEAELPAAEQAIAQTWIGVAEEELQAPVEDQGRLRSALIALKAIAESAAGSAIFAGVLQLAHSLHL